MKLVDSSFGRKPLVLQFQRNLVDLPFGRKLIDSYFGWKPLDFPFGGKLIDLQFGKNSLTRRSKENSCIPMGRRCLLPFVPTTWTSDDRLASQNHLFSSSSSLAKLNFVARVIENMLEVGGLVGLPFGKKLVNLLFVRKLINLPLEKKTLTHPLEGNIKTCCSEGN